MSRSEGKKPFKRLVVKFGGTSLTDGVSISRAADSIVKKAREGVQIAVVVSAIGKTTDSLINIANQACGNIIQRSDKDDVVAMGERTSSRIFSAALRAKGQESCYIDPSNTDWPIITDDAFTNAKPILPLCERMIKRHVKPMIKKGIVVVVPGFIGKTKKGAITTIGRGGSDITALILVQALAAEQVILVTDVAGIMTADPKVVKKPERIEEIPIDALVGLADSGIKFLHNKALRYKSPAIDIKVISNSSGDLDSEGTVIHGSISDEPSVDVYPEPAMAVTIIGKKASESHQTLVSIFEEIKKAEVEILGMSINHDSLILYLPVKADGNLLESLHLIVVKDERTLAMAVRKDLAFIRVKGVGLEETPGILNSITKALNSAGINIFGIFTITSSVLFFVDIKDEEKAVRLTEETIRTNNNQ